MPLPFILARLGGGRAPLALVARQGPSDGRDGLERQATAGPAPRMLPVSRWPRWLRAAVQPGSTCRLDGTIDLGDGDLCAVRGSIRFLNARLERIPSRAAAGGGRPDEEAFFPATRLGCRHAFHRSFISPPGACHIEVCLVLTRWVGTTSRPTASATIRVAISPAVGMADASRASLSPAATRHAAHHFLAD